MDSPSSYNPQDYYVQPNGFVYETGYDMSMDGLPPSDSPRMNFHNLNSLQLSGGPYYPPSSYMPQRAPSPIQAISPPLTNLSASELSGNDNSGQQFNSGHSSGTGSPASSHHEFVHRNTRRPLRASATPAVPARERRKAAPVVRRAPVAVDNDDDFSDDEEPQSVTTVVARRREDVRRQRIESEQRRRDELRDGYRRLKDVLPVSNQKSSKVSLLDRATIHIRNLEVSSQQMVHKINQLERDVQRAREINETLMLSTASERRSSTF